MAAPLLLVPALPFLAGPGLGIQAKQGIPCYPTKRKDIVQRYWCGLLHFELQCFQKSLLLISWEVLKEPQGIEVGHVYYGGPPWVTLC